MVMSHVSSFCLWVLVAVASSPGWKCLSQQNSFVGGAFVGGWWFLPLAAPESITLEFSS